MCGIVICTGFNCHQAISSVRQKNSETVSVVVLLNIRVSQFGFLAITCKYKYKCHKYVKTTLFHSQIQLILVLLLLELFVAIDLSHCLSENFRLLKALISTSLPFIFGSVEQGKCCSIYR